MRTKLILAFILSLGLASCQPNSDQRIRDASAQKVVDPSMRTIDLLSDGPYAVAEWSYDSGPLLDRDILPPAPFDLPEIQTDIRGKLYLPEGQGPFPVLLFLHGNHGTCGLPTFPLSPRLDIGFDFTEQGRCPEGMLEVPSYLGYAYSTRHLASWGYAVVSINANRGITGRNGYDPWDWGLVYARGKLVLRTIEQLQRWSLDPSPSIFSPPGVQLAGKFDWSEVGLMGHSRGGEGVRYAYNIFYASQEAAAWQRRLPNLRIRAIFEIAPVDFGASGNAERAPTKIEAPGVTWTVLIPACDHDVLDFSGSRPYARALDDQDSFPKAVFTIWGANHNFFNSEWQVSDAPHRCVGHQTPLWNTAAPQLPSPFAGQDPLARLGLIGSAIQQDMAKGLLAAFFRSSVGQDRQVALARVFDPQYLLPEQLDRLAATSREFVQLGTSLLLARPGAELTDARVVGPVLARSMQHQVQDDLILQQNYWDAYAQDQGIERIETYLLPGSFFRSSLSLSSLSALRGALRYQIPFAQEVATEEFWTVDLSLARRTPCYEYQVSLCREDIQSLDLGVALILANGQVTPSVRIQDYAQIKNWHSRYFEVLQVDPIPSHGSAFALGLAYIQPLFQTIRIELSDFTVPVDRIRGLELTFPAGEAVSLLVDEVRLSRRLQR